jgi:Delta7-sterol 5-desaturase
MLELLVMLLVETLRYVVIAGAAFGVFWVWKYERFKHRWLARGAVRAAKIVHDIRWSLSTILVFVAVGVITKRLAEVGVVRAYPHIADRGWLYFGFSVVALVVLQDTWFYWTHRAMHHPWLYRLVHKTHHASVQTSPWTAYAFSPFEAATHAVFVPLVWMFVPMHEAAVFVFMMFMLVRNVQGHLSIELYSKGFTRGPLGFTTTTTHHALHHRHYNSNFGLYFMFWDRIMGTTDKRYHDEYDRVVSA